MATDAELLELLLDFVHCTKERSEEWAEFVQNNGSTELKEAYTAYLGLVELQEGN